MRLQPPTEPTAVLRIIGRVEVEHQLLVHIESRRPSDVRRAEAGRSANAGR